MDQDLVASFINDPQRVAASRRAFLRAVGGTGALLGASTLLSGCGGGGIPDQATNPPAPPATHTLVEGDALNFALNLEYLEANFYSFATTGSGIDSSLQTGTGTQGAATGGRMVNFTKGSFVQKYANEIAGHELAHVSYLRRQLGSYAVAQPAIDVGVDPNGAFSKAAQAAGLVSAGTAFDPYASESNFLLAAFIFEDVGVTAYMGAITLITTPAYIEAAAGIHAAEAYHAGLIRTSLYRMGLMMGDLTAKTNPVFAANAISDARDSLDGSSDDDQGITDSSGNANLVPTDANSITFPRTPAQVLDIVYLTNTMDKGGFLPNGVNGYITASTTL